MHLTKYLGFFPQLSGFVKGKSLHLQEGCFTSQQLDLKYSLNPNLSFQIFLLASKDLDYFVEHPFSRQNRSEILRSILNYYSLHVHNFKEVQSLTILESVFS